MLLVQVKDHVSGVTGVGYLLADLVFPILGQNTPS